VTPLLRDPLTGEPVLIAPARAARPNDVRRPAGREGCPFCPGNEARTPPEVLAVRPGGGPSNTSGWLVRAFPNRYPALAPEEGVHEVIANSPRHVARLSDLTDEEASRAVGGWAARLDAVARDPRGLWPFLFLNQGAAGGASLQHTHAQLVGLPFAPPRLVAREHAFAEADRCPICADMADDAARIIAAAEGLVAWCPRVPTLTGAVRVAPAEHAPDWGAGLDRGALGRTLRHLACRIADALGGDALNLWLHQRRPAGTGSFHWHIDLVPRLGTLAGLELGAGVLALTRSPEAIASLLRGGGERGRATAR